LGGVVDVGKDAVVDEVMEIATPAGLDDRGMSEERAATSPVV
jgi:hypothetical protein